MRQIHRALLSVSNKDGLLDLARALIKWEVELISTGGTFALLKKNGIAVTEVSAYTGYPELMDGRVKTLHPRIYGGLLGLRDDAGHLSAMQEHDIPPIDMVVVNLYPFAETIAHKNVTLDEAIEQIDIGGPTLIRAAAKNHRDVAVVTDVQDYERVRQLMDDFEGELPQQFLQELAIKAYTHTSQYDAVIHTWLRRQYYMDPSEDSIFVPQYELVQQLRYGENPHQNAAVYRDSGTAGMCVATAKQLNGKELSYNNLLDLDAALNILREFSEPAAVLIKHNNPCGAACDRDSIVTAFDKAYDGDPMSAFGCVAGVNRPVDAALAEIIARDKSFIEAVLAPSFTSEALEILKSRQKWGKNVRLLETGDIPPMATAYYQEVRTITGGVLVQDKDNKLYDGSLKTVSKAKPDEAKQTDMEFAWKIVKHARSNAIVIARDRMLVGLGAGQVSRVDASRIAVRKAGDRADGAVSASDAFFPFRDGVDALAEAGITAVIQPGGSIRDPDVIAAVDEHNMIMAFTGQRHFKH